MFSKSSKIYTEDGSQMQNSLHVNFLDIGEFMQMVDLYVLK